MSPSASFARVQPPPLSSKICARAGSRNREPTLFETLYRTDIGRLGRTAH